MLDILKATGCLSRRPGGATHCACILHWFSGDGDELHRAVRAGCYFSVGPRMVATKRGREYAKQIPLDRLLLETDDPEGENVTWPYARIRAGLDATFNAIAEAKGMSDPIGWTELAAKIDRTARSLLLGN